MTSRQPKSEEGVLQTPRRTPFVYLVHENSMNMPTAIQHPRIAAIGCVARAWAGVPLTLAVARAGRPSGRRRRAAQFVHPWPRHDAMWPAALALRKFLLEHTSMRARPRSNKL